MKKLQLAIATTVFVFLLPGLVEARYGRSRGQCGNTARTSNRITGGKSAQEPIPWMVAISCGYYKPAFCGGSLISDQWVLTAAHCIHDSKEQCEDREMFVTVGQLCRGDARGRDYSVMRNIIYPKYKFNWNRHDHDIALLQLRKGVTLSRYVAPISLHKKTYLRNISERELHIAGWGVKDDGDLSDVLRTATIKFYWSRTCKRNHYIGHSFTNNMICAGEINPVIGKKGKDTCQGDSGGPLYYKYQNTWYLLGVTAYGPRGACGIFGGLGVYMKVATYVPWIEYEMNQDYYNGTFSYNHTYYGY